MAAHQKKARQLGAYLVLMDESGLLMAPLVRRSWALRGQPPQMKQKIGHREKVSVAGALWLTPRRDRLGLFCQTMVNSYFANEDVALFLDDLRQELRGPLVVIWDGGSMHKGDPIEDLLEDCAGQLVLERLPAHTPELMPLEQLWTWLKYSRLCNFAPHDARQLDAAVLDELAAILDDQERLQNFIHASDLPLPRALLS